MNCTRFRYLLVLLLPWSLNAQSVSVLPGDANDNGVINHHDLLQVGLGYGLLGPHRDSFVLSFNGLTTQNAPAWPVNLPGGLNMAFADCNGDGSITTGDAAFIYAHLGYRLADSLVQEEVLEAGLIGIDPALGFDETVLPQEVIPGQALSVPLTLGDSDIPVEDLYGISFSIFSNGQIDHANMALDFSETSWANHDGDRIYFYKTNGANRLDGAWTRTDRNQRDGFGRIGKMDFVIIVDVIDKTLPVKIWTDSIQMIDRFGNRHSIAGDTLTLPFSPSSFVNVQTPVGAALELYPNPGTDQVFLKSEEPIVRVVVSDLLGKVILEEKNTNAIRFQRHTPAGLYLVSATTQSGQTLRAQIIKN